MVLLLIFQALHIVLQHTRNVVTTDKLRRLILSNKDCQKRAWNHLESSSHSPNGIIVTVLSDSHERLLIAAQVIHKSFVLQVPLI